MGMSIEIGGELHASLIEVLVNLVGSELNDISSGPFTVQEFRKEAGSPIKWNGVTNYGECDALKAWLENHNLTYVHHCEAKYEYDASLKFWRPGLKEEICTASDQEGDVTLKETRIRPVVEVLLAVAKGGGDLPLLIGKYDDALVEKCIKNPKRAVGYVEKELRRILPERPVVPPLVIKE
jgi:hypothetical protein